MKRRLVYAAFGVTCVVAAAVTVFTVSLAVAPYPVADFAAVRDSWRASDAWLLDRNGEPLSRVRIDRERRRGDWVNADDVSPALVAAVLASEDRRFNEHRGIDWLAMLSAVKQTAAGERRGGSDADHAARRLSAS